MDEQEGCCVAGCAPIAASILLAFMGLVYVFCWVTRQIHA